MKLRNDRFRYGLISRFLHWGMAVSIFAMFGLGYWMRTLTYDNPYYQLAPNLHRSIGIVLLAMLIIRFIWNFIEPRPIANDITKLEYRLSHLMHNFLYALLFCLMITGYLISTLDGRPISVFGLANVPSVLSQRSWEPLTALLHWWIACTIITISIVHACAALWHHLIKKDFTLRRMLNL